MPFASHSLFGDALRTALRDCGLTLERARWHLARRGVQIGLSSLGDWQHGRSLPRSPKSLRAVAELEDLLRLPAGALSGLIAESRDRNAGGLDESLLAELIAAVQDDTGAYEVLGRTSRVTVDQHRRASTITDLTVVRGLRPGADRYVLRYFGGPGCRIDDVRFGELTNCRLGRIARHAGADRPALVAELLFDRPLSAGETWVFGSNIIDETSELCTHFAQGFRQPVQQFVLEVAFHPVVTPVEVYAFEETGLGTGRRRRSDLVLSADGMAHVVASDARSGLLGIGWSWADDQAYASIS